LQAATCFGFSKTVFREHPVLQKNNSIGVMRIMFESVCSVAGWLVSVRLFAWNNSASIDRILMKLGIRAFFLNLSRNFKISTKSGKNNGFFT
jgi:hypothetical protein